MPGIEIIKSLLAGMLAGSVSGFLGVSPGRLSGANHAQKQSADARPTQSTRSLLRRNLPAQ
jgi:hypothetical protein